jgi:glyoxylase-like metal-dependent hydrolase (beta-lactamase superfamily II)
MPDVSVTDLGHDLYLIDAHMHDEPERLACYLFDTPERVLIECGPSRSIGHLYDALESIGVDDVAVMAVTHIHLDHAGGAGHFAQRFPNARVGVHSAGARHLVSPERLWDSAERIYTPQGMLDLWGPMEPIDESRLLVLDEGDHIPLGNGRSVEVMYTPGHAKHHIVFYEDETGACMIGDSVGLAFPHGHLVHPNTPPPDFDPHLVVHQMERMAERDPAFLGFAHFGPDPTPQDTLAAAANRLWRWVEWVDAAAYGSDEELTAAMRRWVLDGYRGEGYSDDVLAKYDRNTFWPMQAAGIRRWLSLRDQS